MKQFNCTLAKEGSETILLFEGIVNEFVELPKPIRGSGSVTLDLSQVHMINSSGIGLWVKWITLFNKTCEIKFRKVPQVIIEQMNTVKGFMGYGNQVLSFYTPYYFADTDLVKTVLQESGKTFEQKTKDGEGWLKIPEEIVDQKTQNEGELDVIKDKYFKFILKPEDI